MLLQWTTSSFTLMKLALTLTFNQKLALTLTFKPEAGFNLDPLNMKLTLTLPKQGAGEGTW